MFIVGLTGSLKTGKSTVAKILKGKGAKVVDADQLAHQAIQPQGKCFKKIVRVFGSEILSKGEIDRRKLGKRVFNDQRALLKLEQIIHPVVIQEIKAFIKNDRKKKINDVVVLDVPLLIEAGLDRLVDLTIVVSSKQQLQIKRAVKQLHISPQQARARIAAQMPLKQKIKWADYVISNDGSIPNLRKKVNLIWQKVQQMKRK